ncbi:MAG: toll/interleukin-1 receptor domain-containing protein [Lachnospiraceae bacterium]|nr:toll/interleukin-1 receptor domain-containing protein [Lachnospiraceae bacterium]
MNIFISHSSSEAKVAKEICNELENNGKKCFLAPRDIRSGYEYAEEIANGIDSSNAVLLVLSNASNNSPHVLREVERAVTKRIPILVYKLEEVELTKSMEYFLMTHQWIPARKGDYSDVIRCVNNLENSDRVIAPVSIPQKKSKKPLFIALAGIVAFVLVIAVAMALFFKFWR